MTLNPQRVDGVDDHEKPRYTTRRLRREIDLAVEAAVSELAEENRRLREVISQCADALPNGAFISPKATADFMEKLPEEIRLVFGKLSMKPIAWLCDGKGDGWEEHNKITFDQEMAKQRQDDPRWTVRALFAA